MPDSPPRFDLGPWLLAGALGDAPTGLALICAPELVYGLLGIPLAPPLVHGRLIGAFVGTVGFLYLVAWRRPEHRGALVPALTWFRLAVASTLLVAVALGAPAGYLVVAATDALFAAVQLVWLGGPGGLLWP